MKQQSENGGADRFDRAATRITGISIALLALSVGAFGGLLRPERITNFFSATSAGLMPATVLLALVICGIMLAIRPGKQRAERFTGREIGLKLLALLYLFAYTWILSALGWLLASLVLLVSLPLLAKYRNVAGIAIMTVLVLVSIWAIFVVGIKAPLP